MDERNQTTEVWDLRTGSHAYTFCLAPEQAVIAANEYDRGNKSTWTWPKTGAVATKHGWRCGEFWARNPRADKRRLDKIVKG